MRSDTIKSREQSAPKRLYPSVPWRSDYNSKRKDSMRELKSIHKMGIRLLKMIHREDSSVIPLHLLDVCLSLAQIYAGLFLTAGLIDALLAGAYREAAWQAVVLLGVQEPRDEDVADFLCVAAGQGVRHGL